MNQLAQVSQIQNAQNQNALAQYQLNAARRAEEGQTAIGQAYGKFYTNQPTGEAGQPAGQPSFGQMRQQIVQQLSTSAPHLIPGELAKIAAMEKEALQSKELQGKIDLQAPELQNKVSEQFKKQLVKVNDYDSAVQWLAAQYKNPVLAPIVGQEPFESAVKQIPKDPTLFQDWKNKNALGIEEYIKQNKPVTFAQDTAAGGRLMTRAGLGGEATVVPGSEFTKGMTFADKNAAARLAFDQSKFAFEKANPTLSIQQTPTGYVAVNTTNGLAIPVLYGQAGFQAAGGAQPAATLGASMMRQPPATLPSQRTPVIPGMASVLDQTAAPVVEPTAAPMALPVGTPGTPVMGKQSELKPIPSNINLAILKNNQSIQQIDETIKLLQQNPSATGVKGYLPGFALNRMDPSGVEARAGVADIGSLVLHDRSGAAVTAAEAPRLVPFIPLPTDDNATVIKKLTRMRNIAAQEQTGLTETYGKDQGYAPNPTVGKTGGAPLSAQQIPPIYATNGKERIMSIDGGQTWTPANK
jgi:hypothetical protein